MTDFDHELAQLRADVATPGPDATHRIAARLSRSIAPLAAGNGGPAPRVLPWARPLQLVMSFVVGGVVGASAYGALRKPTVERVYVERPPASAQLPATSTIALPSAVVESEPTAPPLVPSRSAAVLLVASAGGDKLASLAQQQALLDVARIAFAHGNYAETLRTLATHAARFPKSVLAEEREALQIKTLAASDRVQEARASATRFQARHPQSLLLPSIKDSVGAIP
jgi:hypothetical protein